MKCKYIIFDTGEMEIPVVFAEQFQHNTIKIAGANPVSAGFVKFANNTATCYGLSDSLGISSRPEYDAELIQFFIIGK